MFARMLGVLRLCAGLAFVSSLLGCASLGRASGEGPSEVMLGTWLFENPIGDDEQMAVFADGRVVVLYSNGHRDETMYVDGVLEQLNEYEVSRVVTRVREDGALVQRFPSSSFEKAWNRIDETPRTTLLRQLS